MDRAVHGPGSGRVEHCHDIDRIAVNKSCDAVDPLLYPFHEEKLIFQRFENRDDITRVVGIACDG